MNKFRNWYDNLSQRERDDALLIFATFGIVFVMAMLALSVTP